MRELVLTDDEAVAVAARRGGRWMGALPTVDESDAQALLAAAARGTRSLAVHGALEAYGADSNDRVLDAVIDTLPRVVVYATDRSDLRPGGISAMVFRAVDAGEDDRVLAISMPDGVTQLRKQRRSDALSFVDGLVDSVQGRAPDTPRWVVLLAPATLGDGAAYVVDHAGVGVSTYTAGGDSFGPRTPIADLDDLRALV